MSLDGPALRDEIALREASLADARRERAAGELSDGDFSAIEAREDAALKRARAELDAISRQVTSPGTRVRRRRLLVVAATCFAVALAVLLWASLVPRQAGNSITGSVSLSRAQQVQQLLTEAQADVADGNLVTALNAYQRVLVLEPKNVQALTQSGWLDFSAGSSDQQVTVIDYGLKQLREAVTLTPRQAAPRLYYAIVADSTPGNRALAKREFEVFVDLHPSRGQLAVAEPFLVRLGLAKG